MILAKACSQVKLTREQPNIFEHFSTLNCRHSSAKVIRMDHGTMHFGQKTLLRGALFYTLLLGGRLSI